MGPSVLAYYDLAMKVINLLKIPNSILDTAIFPYISKHKNLLFARKVMIIRIAIASFFVILLILFGQYVITFLGGDAMLPSTPILYIQSVLLLFFAITHFVGSSLLVAFGFQRIFNISVVLSLFLYVSFVFIIYIFNGLTLYTILFSTLVVEAFVMCYRVYYCRRYNLL